MELEKLKHSFTVCKVKDARDVDLRKEFCFVGKTDEELSVVCISDDTPKNAVDCSGGWRGLRIKGVLDFSLIGILSKISAVLADNNIGIFAVSTFNTDYIFVKEKNFNKALDALTANGYVIV